MLMTLLSKKLIKSIGASFMPQYRYTLLTVGVLFATFFFFIYFFRSEPSPPNFLEANPFLMPQLKNYFKETNKSYIRTQLAIFRSSFISDEMQEKIKDIFKDSSNFPKLIVYAEIFCPDSQVVVAIVTRIFEISHNFEFQIRATTGNEEIITQSCGKVSIPTVFFDEKPLFCEFPNAVKELIAYDPHAKDEWRSGKYNELIVLDIIDAYQKYKESL